MGDDIELALCECLFGQRQINAGSQSTFQTGSDRLQHMLVLLERLVRQLRTGARSVVAVVGIRDVTDDLLVCGIEQNIRGQCRVLRAFANGIALTEVKQQPGQRQHGRGAADLVVDIHRAQLQWQLDGNAQALLASDDAGGQRRQNSASVRPMERAASRARFHASRVLGFSRWAISISCGRVSAVSLG